MALATPETIRTLQRKLYCKAKQEPGFRFYALYDKVFRADILGHAYALVRRNKGAPGFDGVTFEAIEGGEGVEAFLAELREDLRAKTYRAAPVRRVSIPKPDGGERPLGIPIIRDRVAQAAVKLVIEPIFEADFREMSYGFRPKRSAHDASDAVAEALRGGHADVIDADVSKYFDTIPHAKLLAVVAERIADGPMLGLIQQWLKAPVVEELAGGRGRWGGGKGSRRGTPQGGVISPLLANLYLHLLDRIWERWRLAERCGARLVRYADDLVVFVRGRRGTGVGAAETGAKTPGVEPERGQDAGGGRPRGKLRLPRLHVRVAPQPQERQGVSPRGAVEAGGVPDQQAARRAEPPTAHAVAPGGGGGADEPGPAGLGRLLPSPQLLEGLRAGQMARRGALAHPPAQAPQSAPTEKRLSAFPDAATL